jgi:hypothetical protein
MYQSTDILIRMSYLRVFSESTGLPKKYLPFRKTFLAENVMLLKIECKYVVTCNFKWYL